MQILYDRIRRDGVVRAGNVLKVDRFLNHQMDIELFKEIGKEFKRRFADVEVNKILTIEASGIGIACIVAQYFNVPVVFAKKTKTKNIAGDVYTTKVESFTHGTVYDIIVSKEFLGKGDKVLVIDDFLAKGKALDGLTTLIQNSGAELVGAGIVIEKGFQCGGDIIRKKGIRLESLAIVDSMDEKTGEIVSRGEKKNAEKRRHREWETGKHSFLTLTEPCSVRRTGTCLRARPERLRKPEAGAIWSL